MRSGLLVGLVIVGAVSAAVGDELPVYRLEPGMVLEYASEGERRSKETIDETSTGTTRIVVAHELESGGWRVVLKSESYHTRPPQSPDGKPSTQETRRFNVHNLLPDGRAEAVEGFPGMASLNVVIPALPRTPEELADGWEVREATINRRLRWRALDGAGQPGQTLRISMAMEDIMNEVYGHTFESTLEFDTVRGLPVSRETRTSDSERPIAVYMDRLTTVSALEPAEQQALARELRTMAEAMAEYLRLYAASENSTTDPAKLYDDAAGVLSSTLEQLTVPELRTEIEAALGRHADHRKYAIEKAIERAAIINKAAPEWELADIDGTTHTLAGYRGKVVVLDFWYKGCGWCIAAMPDIIKVAAKYADKPVAVLGMNTDRREEDARFVIKKMSLNYPTLKAQGIPEKYAVNAFPTLVVIDQKGILREFHEGYTPTLADTLTTTIEKLLAEEAP